MSAFQDATRSPRNGERRPRSALRSRRSESYSSLPMRGDHSWPALTASIDRPHSLSDTHRRVSPLFTYAPGEACRLDLFGAEFAGVLARAEQQRSGRLPWITGVSRVIRAMPRASDQERTPIAVTKANGPQSTVPDVRCFTHHPIHWTETPPTGSKN